MFKKLILGATLALTLAGGAITSASFTAASAAPVAVAQALPGVQLAAAVHAPAALQGVQLSAAQLSSVQGDGLWSKFKKWVKKVVKKVIGVIIQEIVKAISEWLEQIVSNVIGGETQESTTKDVENYASQADYDAGIISSTGYEETPWVQTSMWYGDSGGCGGESYDGGQLYMQREMVMTSC